MSQKNPKNTPVAPSYGQNGHFGSYVSLSRPSPGCIDWACGGTEVGTDAVVWIPVALLLALTLRDSEGAKGSRGLRQGCK